MTEASFNWYASPHFCYFFRVGWTSLYIDISLCLFRYRVLVHSYNLSNFVVYVWVDWLYLEDCDFLIITLTTHVNSLKHMLLLLRGTISNFYIDSELSCLGTG